MAVPSYETHIEEDIEDRADWEFQYPVRNQQYVLMSIIHVKGSDQSGVKIFGAFPTLEKANEEAANISKLNDFFDVYVCPTNAWVPVPPTPQQIEDKVYHEDRLNNLKQSYMEMQEGKAAEMRRRIEKDHESKKKAKEAKEALAIEDGNTDAVVVPSVEVVELDGVEEQKEGK
jgi:hypothetical protein